MRLATISRSDRADVAMLALPILLIAFTIAVGHWTNPDHRAPGVATLTPGAKRALTGLPPVATPVSPLAPTEAASTGFLPIHEIQAAPSTFASSPIPAATQFDRLALASPPPTPLAVSPAEPAAIPAAATGFNLPARASDAITTVGIAGDPPEPIAGSKIKPVAAPPTNPARQPVAFLAPDRAADVWELPGGLEALVAGFGQCRFDPSPPRSPVPVTWTAGDPESFGLALATAARRQLEEFVIYNDRYTRMKYPMGDVHPMYGVCTDVIVRAYRALGLDLQELVQKTKTGSGDPNIDHRRVDTLRKFFSRFGESLPISSFAENYKAGDIVTYWRPQNRHSRTHIAVVSDMTGPSGRPLIIHNRGWGPQQEDGLFVDEITGHYRFSGLKNPAAQTQTEQPPKPSKSSKAPPITAKQAPERPVVRTGLSAPTAPPL
jgi:uncharacterized protein YijF (DUF1287 family)